MTLPLGPAPRRVVFLAQYSVGSFVNDALDDLLPTWLAARGYELVSFRAWAYVKSRPLLLARVILGAIRQYGLGCLRSKTKLADHVTKSTAMYDLASRLMRERVAATPHLACILQVGGLFDSTVPGVPLVLYGDDVILNREHGHHETVRLDQDIVARERRLYAAADGFAVMADHVVTALVENYGYPRSRTRVVRCGLNARPADGPVPEGRYEAGRIVVIGRDWERKGGPELVAAFERLAPRFPHARLVVIGAQPDISHPQIDVLGPIPLDEIGARLAGASIFCMPSRLEPAGIAPLEAAAAGLPVVVTATGGLPQTVEDGTTGYLLPVGDVEGLEAALARLLADPALCRTMGEAGKARVERLFGWDKTTEAIAILVDEVVCAHERAAEALAA